MIANGINSAPPTHTSFRLDNVNGISGAYGTIRANEMGSHDEDEAEDRLRAINGW